ncbi:hypothetical protein [Flavobacterium sp. 40-81]|nr:hypothetical protein [Flavobacterium sp. 40-81]MBN9284125.1 hypothetical protein [Flavobacterium sp.]
MNLWSGIGLKAQTWNEWFNQNATQKKYLKQQIAALQVYINYGKEGYKIAKEGLSTIGNMSRGEFNLHEDYFTSLKNVNPRIKNYQKVDDIITLQVRILSGYQQLRPKINQSDLFTSSERAYLNGVYTRLLAHSDKTLDELLMVITDQKLEMTDEQRISRVDNLHREMQNHFGFFQSFTKENQIMVVARLKEKNEAGNSRVWQGIN